MAMVGIAFRDVAETVAPDLPGYGHTALARGTVPTYDDWVRLVVDLIVSEQQRDGRPVVLFGASMGGLLAYDAAAQTGTVAGVVATCLLDPADREAVRAAVRHPAMARSVPLLGAMDSIIGRLRVPMRLLVNMRAIANDPALTDALLADRTAAGASVPLRFLASFLDSERPVRPEQATTPLLLVHPGDDRWTPPAVSRRFLDRIAAPTRYVELERCGHIPVEEPGLTQMQKAVMRFLADVAPQ